MKYLDKARTTISRFKTEIEVYRLVLRHPRTPRLSRIILGIAIAYAFSPIDLIPDFIPVLGYLDDVLIIPLGIFATMKLIPPDVLSDCRVRAREATANKKPVNWIAGTAIILIWLVLAIVFARLIYTV